MRCNSWISLLYLFFWTLSSQGQTLLSGTITNEANEPLPFATVYEQGSTNGSTSNAHGQYQLRVATGNHVIVAQYIGYGKQQKSITIGESPVELHFQLSPEALILKEVVIAANERDPAKRVIRNAIKKRKYYRDEVSAFACDVYIKGLQRLDKKPKSLLGVPITIDTGVVYLSESISKLKYLAPDKINETMISSKLSGQSNGFSYNMASDMLINLYDNSFFIEGLSERPLISPLANNAFLYYDYKMAGTFLENDLLINKIELIPKRRTDPVFKGYIYIIEDSWRIHSVDVALTKDNGIEFVDSLRFNQVFAPSDYGVWMPISQRFTFKFKAFGFAGSGHFTAIYSNYKLQYNYWLPPKVVTSDTLAPPESPITSKPNKNTQEPLFKKEDFSKAIMTVVDGSNEKDSIYWAAVRPIPLTSIEIKDYQIKDSIQLIRDTREYKDSVDHKNNKIRVGNLLASGYTLRNSYKRTYLTFPTVLSAVQYNAVEGLVGNFEFTYQKRNKTTPNYVISPSLRYGFGNKKLQAQVNGAKSINAKRQEWVFGGLGRYVFQMNESNPIADYGNSYFSSFWGENYAKFYQKTFVRAGYQKEVSNGLLLKGELNYNHRESMDNTATFNFQNKTFQSNAPFNQERNQTAFSSHQALIFEGSAKIRINQEYIDRPDRKINLESKYPELILTYKKGIPGLGSDVNYDLVKLGIDYKKRLGHIGESQLSTVFGAFLNTQQMYFLDYQHFNGNKVYLRQPTGDHLFQLLDYYEFSTKDNFAQAHYEHHFNEFIFNKIPFVRKLNLQAVAAANYLRTPTLGNYFELGAGIEHILKVLRLDYYVSYRNGNFHGAGIKFGAGF
ncbi:MAG: hypothetical protein ACI83W_001960 [Marinoscillum sp.]|jgi:hypothetical protein